MVENSNIGSMHSLFGAPLGSAYSARGVVLTKSLANTWAKANIQVNAVLPEYIDTTLTRPLDYKPGLKKVPAGHWGIWEEMLGVLSSDASNYVTEAIPCSYSSNNFIEKNEKNILKNIFKITMHQYYNHVTDLSQILIYL